MPEKEYVWRCEVCGRKTILYLPGTKVVTCPEGRGHTEPVAMKLVKKGKP